MLYAMRLSANATAAALYTFATVVGWNARINGPSSFCFFESCVDGEDEDEGDDEYEDEDAMLRFDGVCAADATLSLSSSCAAATGRLACCH
jgi:hypothetical protein